MPVTKALGCGELYAEAMPVEAESDFSGFLVASEDMLANSARSASGVTQVEDQITSLRQIKAARSTGT